MKKISGYLIAVAIIVSIITLIGWQFDIDSLKRPLGLSIALNPLAAVGFIVSGIAFYLLYKVPHRKIPFFIAPLLVLGVMTVAILKLLFWTGTDLGIDQWLFKEKILAENTFGFINRMSFNTALGLLLLCTFMLFSPIRGRKIEFTLSIMALIVFMIGLFAFIGFVFHVREYYSVLRYIQMALPGAACFICFSLGLLFENPDMGMMAVVSSRHAGGKMARRLIPAILLVPIVLGYICLYALHAVPLSGELASSILITSIIIVLFAFVWLMARALNTADVQARHSARQLKHEAQLFNILPYAVIYGDSDLTITNFNAAAEKLFEVNLAQAKGLQLNQVVNVEVDELTQQEARVDLWGEPGIWYGGFFITTRSGKRTGVKAILKAVKDDSGNNSGWVGVYREI